MIVGNGHKDFIFLKGKYMIADKYPTGTPSRKWDDFEFDCLTLQWIDKNNIKHQISYHDLVFIFKKLIKWDSFFKWTSIEIGRIKPFHSACGIPEDGVESLVYGRYDYFGILFEFETKKHFHQIKFFHTEEGIVQC